MKKNFVFAIMCLLIGLGVSAKDGDRFEWRGDRFDDEYATLLFEVVSEVEKTLQVVEIYSPNHSIPIRLISTPGRWSDIFSHKLPEKYKDYKIIKICDKAFYDMELGTDVENIHIEDVPYIGNYAFWGSCRRGPFQNGVEQLRLENIESIGEYAFANSNISLMQADCWIPPSAYMNSFSEWTMENCLVNVPYESWFLYLNHPVWGRFQRLVLSVDDIETEDVYFRVFGNEIIVSGASEGSVISVYDITGRYIDTITYSRESDNTITTPGGGIYVLQCAGKSYKIKV